MKQRGTEAMFLIMYSSTATQSGDLLEEIVHKATPHCSKKTCYSLEELLNTLRWPRSDKDVVLVLAPSKADLEQMCCLRQLFSDVRMLLILPDRQPDTITNAHSLFPRFLTYADANLLLLKAVLTKLSLQNQGGQRGRWQVFNLQKNEPEKP
jgi:hypothetical protein